MKETVEYFDDGSNKNLDIHNRINRRIAELNKTQTAVHRKDEFGEHITTPPSEPRLGVIKMLQRTEERALYEYTLAVKDKQGFPLFFYPFKDQSAGACIKIAKCVIREEMKYREKIKITTRMVDNSNFFKKYHDQYVEKMGLKKEEPEKKDDKPEAKLDKS